MCFSLPTDNRVKRDFYHAISSFVTWIESLTRTLPISISSYVSSVSFGGPMWSWATMESAAHTHKQPKRDKICKYRQIFQTKLRV